MQYVKNSILAIQDHSQTKKNDGNRREIEEEPSCHLNKPYLIRDYGISMFKDSCVFSIYKHSAEYPIFMVKKNISKSNKSDIFSAVAIDGRILSRSSKLSSALKPLEVKLIRSVK